MAIVVYKNTRWEPAGNAGNWSAMATNANEMIESTLEIFDTKNSNDNSFSSKLILESTGDISNLAVLISKEWRVSDCIPHVSRAHYHSCAQHNSNP